MRLSNVAFMFRVVSALFLMILLTTLAALSSGTPPALAQGATAAPTGAAAKIPKGLIKHIVFFIKENRTFDNYFGTFPGANGATSAVLPDGQTVQLQHQADNLPFDIDHSSQGAFKAFDGGKMDMFNLLSYGANKASTAPYMN